MPLCLTTSDWKINHSKACFSRYMLATRVMQYLPVSQYFLLSYLAYHFINSLHLILFAFTDTHPLQGIKNHIYLLCHVSPMYSFSGIYLLDYENIFYNNCFTLPKLLEIIESNRKKYLSLLFTFI